MNLIVGAGKVFKEYYLPNINNFSNYKIYDKSKNNDNKKFVITDELSEVLKHEYETIFILSPPNKHFENYSELVSNSNTFYIEKPIFSSSKELNDAISLRPKVNILGGYSRRFFHNYIEFKKYVEYNSSDSELLRINIQEGYPYQWNPVMLETIIQDELSHLVDTLFYVSNLHTQQNLINLKNVTGDIYKEIEINGEINNTKIEIKFSRTEDLINHIRLDYSNGESYILNLKLNGSFYKVQNKKVETFPVIQKQSSVSVFRDILSYINKDSYKKNDFQNLQEFKNTINFIDNVQGMLI